MGVGVSVAYSGGTDISNIFRRNERKTSERIFCPLIYGSQVSVEIKASTGDVFS